MNNEFLNDNEELKRVAEEITLLRRDLQTTSATLGRIERRLKASFNNYPETKKNKKNSSKNKSTKESEELLSLFDEIVSKTKEGGEGQFTSLIDELSEEDLIAIAVEIGVSSPSKLSRKKSIDGIRKRVQESLQLQFHKR